MAEVIWHPSVHEHFREFLYYYFISGFLYWAEFRDKVIEALDNEFKDVYTLYPIYGHYDAIVKIWAQPDRMRKLDITLQELRKVTFGSAMRVTVDPNNVFYPMNDLQRFDKAKILDVLTRTNPDEILGAQEDIATCSRKEELEEIGVIIGTGSHLKEGQIRGNILFQFLEDIVRIKHFLVENFKKVLAESRDLIEQPMFCHGEGVYYSFLVTGVFNNFSDVFDLIEMFRKDLTPFQMRSETYLSVRSEHPDKDRLDSDGIREFVVFRDVVPRWIAEEAEPRVKYLVGSCAIELQDLVEKTDVYAETLIKAVANEDVDAAVGVIARVSADSERDFRKLIKLLGEEKFGTGYEKALEDVAKETGLLRGGRKEEVAKPLAEWTLGDCVQVFDYWDRNMRPLFPKRGEDANKILREFVTLRNQVVHRTRDFVLADMPRLSLYLRNYLQVLYDLKHLAQHLRSGRR